MSLRWVEQPQDLRTSLLRQVVATSAPGPRIPSTAGKVLDRRVSTDNIAKIMGLDCHLSDHNLGPKNMDNYL